METENEEEEDGGIKVSLANDIKKLSFQLIKIRILKDLLHPLT